MERERIRTTPLSETILSKKRISYKKLIGIIEEEDNDERLQELLDSLSPASLRNFRSGKVKNRESPFASLGGLLIKLGFSPLGTSLVAENLKGLVPIRNAVTENKTEGRNGKRYDQTYYIFYLKHRERVIAAVEALAEKSEDPRSLGFKKAKFEVICGKNSQDPMPTTAAIKLSEKYRGVWNVILGATGLNIRRRRSVATMREFLLGCPVRVVRYKGQYYCPVEQEGAFLAFVRARAEKFRGL